MKQYMHHEKDHPASCYHDLLSKKTAKSIAALNAILVKGAITNLEWRDTIKDFGSNSYFELIEPFFDYIKRQIVKGYQ